VTDVFRQANVRRLVRLALEEDVGRGDVTTAATIPRPGEMIATVSAREALVVAGTPIAAVVLAAAGAADAKVRVRAREGKAIARDTVLVEITTDAATALGVERVLLNFLQRMSGVATLTRRYVDAVSGTGARIVDTRKTLPGWRLLDKYAVRMGGGTNHRFGLDDGILIKDNHVVACGGIPEAVKRARAAASHLLRVEVECETLTQVDEAIAAGAEAILLDNMKTADIAAAVSRIDNRAIVEASGGMTLERVREVAETGVDLISVGALTHSAPAVDLSLDLARPK
jgi:nicotinate-nucleotide pyrophosphorylase (carboxylating)